MRIKPSIFIAILAVATLASTSVHAQTSQPKSNPIELGVSGMGLLFGDSSMRGVGGRVGLPLTRHLSFEAEVDWLGFERVRRSDDVGWIYLMQVKATSPVPFHPRTTVFATAGGTGWADRSQTGPDQWTVSVTPPILATVGGGVQQIVSRNLAVRVDGQLLLAFYEDIRPMTGRISAGLSFAIGGFKTD